MTVAPDASDERARRPNRVLAIDPMHRGFGYAVHERSHRLVDWGIAYVLKSERQRWPERVEQLIKTYEPDIVVSEDVEALGSRRGKHARFLIASVQRLATKHDLGIGRVSNRNAKLTLCGSECATKHDIMVALSVEFPELAPLMPKRRKCYMSEAERAHVYMAVARAVVLARAPQEGARVTIGSDRLR